MIAMKRSLVKSKRYSSWTEMGKSIGWTQNRYVRVWCRDIEKGRCATFRYALTWLVQDEQERDKIGVKPCRDCSQLQQVEYSNSREMKNDEWRFWTPYEPWMGVLAQWKIDDILDAKAHDYALAVTEHLIDNQIAKLQYELSLNNEEE